MLGAFQQVLYDGDLQRERIRACHGSVLSAQRLTHCGERYPEGDAHFEECFWHRGCQPVAGCTLMVFLASRRTVTW